MQQSHQLDDLKKYECNEIIPYPKPLEAKPLQSGGSTSKAYGTYNGQLAALRLDRDIDMGFVANRRSPCLLAHAKEHSLRFSSFILDRCERSSFVRAITERLLRTQAARAPVVRLTLLNRSEGGEKPCNFRLFGHGGNS
jgi:hypothetical protein